MQKLFSELIGMPIIEEFGGGRIMALVRDIVVDPDNGAILAFVVGSNKMLLPMDIQYIGANILVHGADSIIPFDEVVHVQKVINENGTPIWAKVYTDKNNVYVGRVFDYVVNTSVMSLTALHIAKSFLVFHYDELIISAKKIVRMEKGTVFIKDFIEKKPASVKKIVEPRVESTASLA